MLGTEATVVQPYVDRLAAEFAADCTVIRHGSAELVELAEAKLRGEATDPAAYRDILAGLLDQPGGERIDTVVLACTHFPLVQRRAGSSEPAPARLRRRRGGDRAADAWLTRDLTWPDAPSEGRAVVTGPLDEAEPYRAGFARFGLTRIEKL